MSSETARLGLDEPSATENISGFPAEDVEALGILDNAAIYYIGTLANRSTVTPLYDGTIYRATDTEDLAVWNGSSWEQLVRGSNAICGGNASLTFTNGFATNLVVNHSLGAAPVTVVVTDFANSSPNQFVYSTFGWTSTSFTVNAVAGGSYSGAKGFSWLALR